MNGNGNGTFNSQILVDKLTKLNTSQQSIETLSHWCIFHRMKARQVVEIWDRQFHHSSRDQRLSFLYLANDILQNSRRKGVEFVTEFWKVLPDALNDLIEKGDDFERKAALRLVEIWEDRKVFGSRGHVLKEEILCRNSENRKSSEKSANYKLKIPGGELLEKIISDYEHIYNEHIDEKALLGRCSSAITSMTKMNQEIGSDLNSGNISGSGAIEELKDWHNILRECVGQLRIAESSRMALQSHLREALHEQELKLEQVRDQLQAMLSRYEQTSNFLLQLQSMNTTEIPPEAKTVEASASIPDTSADFTGDNCSIAGGNYNIKQESLVPVRYTQQQQQPPLPPTDTSLQPEEELRKKATAAEVAAKLTSSTSSAQMLSYVFSSLASESIIVAGSLPMRDDYSSSHHIGKRPKIENGCGNSSNSSTILSYLPTPLLSQPPPPPFPHPDSVNPPPPPPPSSPLMRPLLPPLMPPAHLSHFIRPMGVLPAMAAAPYSFASSHPQMQPLLYSAVGMPLIQPIPPNNDNNGNNTNITLQSFQMADSGFGSFTMLPATPSPLSRQ